MSAPVKVGHLGVEFDSVLVDAETDRGTPYKKRILFGMPRLPEGTTKLVFYLYKTKSDAEKGADFGGTGFLVGIKPKTFGERMRWFYGVTNWHVAMRDGFSVIRVNRRDGGSEIIELEPHDWIAHPDGDDLAITECPLSLRDEHHDAMALPTDQFVSQQMLETWGIGQTLGFPSMAIGVGDDVFMVGRFIDHDGGPTNNPALRFGNISIMPSPIEQPTKKVRDSFFIDMHSRAGYSGSPVLVYRTPGTDLAEIMRTKKMQLGACFVLLLGVHWGQFPETWKVEGSNQHVKGVSGMTAVVPAWRIIEMLNLPRLKEIRALAKKIQDADDSAPMAESASGSSGGDGILRTMLKTPPTPVTKPKAKAKKRDG